MRNDLNKPPAELELGKDESIRWVPIESQRSFVPSLITPGDQIMFILPKVRPGPTRAAPAKPATEAKTADSVPAAEIPKPEEDGSADYAFETEEVGPFTVVTVGNRLGDFKVMQAAKIPQLQENLLGIRVGPKNSKEWVNVNNLWNRLQALNFRQVGVAVLHGRK